jgi:hypothetical protein
VLEPDAAIVVRTRVREHLILPAADADFSQLYGIAFTHHGRANDSPGDDLNHRIATILQAELIQGSRECVPYAPQVLRAERAVCSQVRTYRHERVPARLVLMPDFRQAGCLALGFAAKMIQLLGELIAARQRKPAPLEVQKVLFHFSIGLRGRPARTIFGVLQALAHLLAQIFQHGALLGVSSRNTIGLSVNNIWARAAPS